MAKIQTIQAEQGLDTQRSTMPDINLDMSQYQAVQELGANISSIGFKAAARYKAQQDQLKGYKTERLFQKFQNDVDQDITGYEQEADPSGENFHKNYGTRFDAARSEFESQVPTDLLPEYQVKTENFKGQVGNRTAQKEVELRTGYYETTLNSDVDGLAASIQKDPSLSNDAWSTIEKQVQMSGLSPTKKAERLQVYRAKINDATVQGFVANKQFEEARDFIEHLGPAPSVLKEPTMKERGVVAASRVVVYSHVDYTNVKPNVKSAVNSVSSELGIPLRVTSGYRDLKHPVEVAKGPKALHRHTTGTAVDLDMKGYDQDMRAKVIKGLIARGATGLGVYPNSPDMIHVDWSGLGAGAADGGISGWYGKGNLDTAPQWFKNAYTEGLQSRRSGVKTDSSGSPTTFVDVTPNTMHENNWKSKNFDRWEFGGPEFEADTPVVAAFDLMTSSLGKKLPFKAKQDSVKLRLDSIPEAQREDVIRSAMASGFSGLNFASDERGEFVTMRVDTQGITNKPKWLPDKLREDVVNFHKKAGLNAKFIPRGDPDADKLMKYIEDGESKALKDEETATKERQSETAKVGWDLYRNDQVTDKWLTENRDNLSETDYRMFSTKLVADRKKAATGEDDAPFKVDQTEYVNLMSRASDPNDKTVIEDAVAAQTLKEISKTDFNKIYDRYQKSITPGKLGKEASWKARTRQYIVDKITPTDSDEKADKAYLESRLEAANEFDTYLEEHPDVTADIAKAQADAILKKYVKSTTVDKRAKLEMGALTVGRYQVALPDITNAARQLSSDLKSSKIDQLTFNTEIRKLMAWKKVLDEEDKAGN